MNPRSLRTLVMGAGVILGGILTLNLASTVTLKTLHLVSEKKRKKVALPCMACRGKGFYICKLCKGNSTVEWSPLYDPFAINPCLCPTCQGNRVQRLNQATCGGFIRDYQGRWILGFQRMLGHVTITAAEILAIQTGLEMCRLLQLKDIQVFSDSLKRSTFCS